MTDKIFICGDPHGVFDHIVEATLAHKPAAVVLLGDNTSARPLHIELESILASTSVWWIHGNHDTDCESHYDNLFGSALADRNLHSRVVEIAGVRIAGLGGVFRTKVWDDPGKVAASPENFLKSFDKSDRWRGGLPLKHRTTIFRSQVATLSRQRADVLVTHEAPELHPHGSAALGQLAVDMRVTKAFHGHHHQDIDYPGSVWRGVGFRGIVTLDGQVIRASDKYFAQHLVVDK